MSAGDAVLMETRPLPQIQSVLLNSRSVLPQSWTVHFWHGPSNSHVAFSSALAPAVAAGSLHLRLLNLSSIAAAGRSWYNAYLLSPSFWNSFSARQLLLFEADSVFCPSPTVSLEAFSEYAFVGAPFPLNKRTKTVRTPRRLFVPATCFNLEHCVRQPPALEPPQHRRAHRRRHIIS
eukprot:6797711-Prymnesium_polylepis.1